METAKSIVAKETVYVANKLEKVFLWMLIFIPISMYFAFLTDSRVAAFVTSILAIIPLARIMGYATDELALQTSPTIGGLLQVTFGNLVELFIAILLLSKGLLDIVRASVIGSIIGNILLLIGMSIFFGGLKFKEQKFNKDSAGVSATMLIIAITGLAIPTVYAFTAERGVEQVQFLSNAVAIVLAIIYLAGLVFAFFTHKHLFDISDNLKAINQIPTVSKRAAIFILMVGTLFVALESDILVKGVEIAAQQFGLTQAFIGIVIIAILSNMAEMANSIQFARRNKLDLALEIGLNGAIQVALFVVPILVLISQIFGYGFSLQFTLFEIISALFAIMIVNYLSSDGRCNWLEGAQLISVYLIIAIAFYFI